MMPISPVSGLGPPLPGVACGLVRPLPEPSYCCQPVVRQLHETVARHALRRGNLAGQVLRDHIDQRVPRSLPGLAVRCAGRPAAVTQGEFLFQVMVRCGKQKKTSIAIDMGRPVIVRARSFALRSSYGSPSGRQSMATIIAAWAPRPALYRSVAPHSSAA